MTNQQKDINIEEFVAGCKEIDRQRTIINRVIGSIISFASLLDRKQCNQGQILAEVTLAVGSNFQLKMDYHAGIVPVLNSMEGTYEFPSGPNFHNRVIGERLSNEDVLIIFSKLSDIVMATDEKIPRARICSRFQWFIEQAPDSE